MTTAHSADMYFTGFSVVRYFHSACILLVHLHTQTRLWCPYLAPPSLQRLLEWSWKWSRMYLAKLWLLRLSVGATMRSAQPWTHRRCWRAVEKTDKSKQQCSMTSPRAMTKSTSHARTLLLNMLSRFLAPTELKSVLLCKPTIQQCTEA